MRKIINCPYCGKIHSIELDSDLSNLYILPGTKQRSKFLWGSFGGDKRKILVSEATCPYCDRVFTVVSLKSEMNNACVIKRPPMMRILFAGISFSFRDRKVHIYPLYWILFSMMIVGYFRERLMLSLLFAVLLIAFVFLLRGINDFQTFDFFGKLPLNLSRAYLEKNASVLNCLFISNTFKEIVVLEIFSLGFGLFKFFRSGQHTLLYFIYYMLVSLFIAYLFMVPVFVVSDIDSLIETFSYKIAFDKWLGFNELGRVILNVLSSSLVMSTGFALFVFITENKALVAIVTGIILSSLTGLTGINLLVTHHKNIKRAKLREIEKLQKALQEEYEKLSSNNSTSTKFSELKVAIDAVKEIEEWPRSFKYLVTAMVTVGTMVISALISHFLNLK